MRRCSERNGRATASINVLGSHGPSRQMFHWFYLPWAATGQRGMSKKEVTQRGQAPEGRDTRVWAWSNQRRRGWSCDGGRLGVGLVRTFLAHTTRSRIAICRRRQSDGSATAEFSALLFCSPLPRSYLAPTRPRSVARGSYFARPSATSDQRSTHSHS